VQAERVSSVALLASIPIGALATGILVANNLRDRETDRAANKRTLVVRFGRPFAIAEHAVLLLASFGAPVVLFLTTELGALVLLPLLSAPLALAIHRDLWRTDGRALNATLKKSGMLLLSFALLFALGIALEAG
jgi:1,4-dihydroxy-2-naphthoate octaprenyltransferase